MSNPFFIIAVIVWATFCIGAAICEGIDYRRKKRLQRDNEQADIIRRIQDVERQGRAEDLLTEDVKGELRKSMPLVMDMLMNPAVQAGLQAEGLKVNWVELANRLETVSGWKETAPLIAECPPIGKYVDYVGFSEGVANGIVSTPKSIVFEDGGCTVLPAELKEAVKAKKRRKGTDYIFHFGDETSLTRVVKNAARPRKKSTKRRKRS